MIELLTALWVVRAARGGQKAAGQVTLASTMTAQKYRGEDALSTLETPFLEFLKAFKHTH